VTAAERSRAAARSLRIDLDAPQVGGAGGFADPEERWADALGLSPAWSVLVRPDGCMAWRRRGAGSAAALEEALSTVLGLDGAGG